MFKVDENERDVEVTRGDMFPMSIDTTNEDGTPYTFRVGDNIRFKVFEKKNVQNVVINKTFTVTEETQNFDIELTSEDTKIGELINKPVAYWYEIELNPDTPYAHTIMGYDRKEGPAIFWLLPEGGDK